MEQGAGAAVASRIALGIVPAVNGQVLANLDLEVDFLMQPHAPLLVEVFVLGAAEFSAFCLYYLLLQ
jgi:hypothetical protein